MEGATQALPGLRDLGEALLGALESGELVAAADIVEARGLDLVHGGYAGAVVETARSVPVDLAEGRPGLGLRFEDLGRLPTGTTELLLPATTQEAQEEAANNGDLLLRHALIRLVTHRRQAEFEPAMSLIENSRPMVRACIYPVYGDSHTILPYWLLQAGITAEHAGDLQQAQQYFLNAWTHRARDPYGFVARGIAVNLALLTGFNGDAASSAMWLERVQETTRRDDLWVDHPGEANRSTAVAIQLADQLEPLTDPSLQLKLSPGIPGAMWPLALWVTTQDALTFGNTARAFALLQEARDGQRPELFSGGIAPAIESLLQAEIHLAMGQGQQALTVMVEAPDVAGLVCTTRARTLLLADQPFAALGELTGLAGDPAVSPRAHLDALVVAAAAHEATGNREAAVTAAQQCAALVSERGAIRTLATVPRALLDQLVNDVPELGPLLARLDERRVRDIYPGMVRIISITRRERELLRALGSGLTLHEIADRSHVTVNTTRTHLANLRRKLDARNRDEVLRKAHLLGLLNE